MAANISRDDVLKFIGNMSVSELVELVKDIEKEFDVSAQPIAAAPAAAVDKGGESAADAKTEFEVVLSGFGDSKINVIKAVRKITGLGLKEAKELVESAPSQLKSSVSKEEADEIKKEIEAAGGTVDIK